ncbi:nitroreductase family protein [Dethiothermospora halolimnae]|uniref:nitroreductase family protein n=1 Tax=Dethiothermospora halolimnae TaxID=3114390 RepID=UPI003CCC01C9
MMLTDFLKERRSVREYKNKKVKTSVLTELIDYGESINDSKGSLEFILFEDGKEIYKELDGKAGYSGVMIDSPHYIGITLKDYTVTSLVKSGYIMEDLVSKISEMGLGTCWITVEDIDTDLKKELFKTENISYIVAIGYPKNRKPYQEIATSSRHSIEEIVYLGEWGNNIKVDELEKRGLEDLFYYVRYAPSQKNSQPWRFILKEGKVELAVENPFTEANIVDSGIMMYYFEKMAHSIGINKKWNIVEEGTKELYTVLGEFPV